MASKRDSKGRFLAGVPKGFKAAPGGGFIPSSLGIGSFGRGKGIQITKVGQWAQARKILSTAPFALPIAIRKAVKQEGQFMRKMMVQNMTQQGALVGAPFAPHAASTKLTRKFRRRPTGKVLIDRADLRNSITVEAKGDAVFIGVLRTARGKNGRPLAKIARVHEFGQTIAIPVTPAMIRFLHLMFSKSSPQKGQSGRSKGLHVGDTLIVKVPARPFIQPVADKFYSNPVVVRARFNMRLGALLGGTFGGLVAGGGVKP